MKGRFAEVGNGSIRGHSLIIDERCRRHMGALYPRLHDGPDRPLLLWQQSGASQSAGVLILKILAEFLDAELLREIRNMRTVADE